VRTAEAMSWHWALVRSGALVTTVTTSASVAPEGAREAEVVDMGCLVMTGVDSSTVSLIRQ
jgi:hypothetical protein